MNRESDADWAETESVICGCFVCMGGKAIYDGTIILVKRDGSLVNRFKGEGSDREKRIDALVASYQASRAASSLDA